MIANEWGLRKSLCPMESKTIHGDIEIMYCGIIILSVSVQPGFLGHNWTKPLSRGICEILQVHFDYRQMNFLNLVESLCCHSVDCCQSRVI